MKTSENGLKLIQEFENFVNAPYLDSARVWTIGYGSTYYPNGKPVTGRDKPITREYAETIQRHVIATDFEPVINDLLKKEIASGFITQNMYDAIVSLTYNIGINGFKRSSVLRLLKQGDKSNARNAFLLWNMAGGKVLRGLVRRRERERKLFLNKKKLYFS